MQVGRELPGGKGLWATKEGVSLEDVARDLTPEEVSEPSLPFSALAVMSILP